jgi:hypothetical protein
MSSLVDSFVFGAANSLHCACMCGPFALLIHGGIRGAAAYHSGRLLAYGVFGIGLGAVGASLGAAELRTPTAIVAFVLAGGILLLLFGGQRGALRVPGLAELVPRLLARARGLQGTQRALLIGLLTPLLPCGLLWAAFAAAAVAGSPLGGGSVMVGFAAGSLPLLAIAQTQAPLVARRFGRRSLVFLQRGAMLLAAGMLVYRGIASLTTGTCCG